ncbi:type II toxin-antitoxin system VapC family toxin [Thiocapsa sp.]|uniref:type II toxin-antitoxin system VapC family toxin n=1 Tax=Thiocapsa sp. TaxID=2024551 RepID=UPI002CB03DBA|nr:type II toxin-antitoxin system VapC family toxin [Thiocapsa sp.]HSO84088.1 type II toxin-antitoxin system VapC family toxin [Thiocapsa sp.]
MKLLLDTQIMLWWLLGDSRLRAETRELMATTRCQVSVASIWEVAIKHRLGKLPVDPVSFRDESLAVGATLLGIDDKHVIETGQLPAIHEDPFDRLIIAQARTEGLVAVSSDARWDQYDIALRRP